jgi:putative transposase
MKYAFVHHNRRVWPIRVQCGVLRVSVSGYHEHLVGRRDILRRRHLSNEALLVYIRAVYAKNQAAYGWPRIWRQLRGQGIRVGKQRVQRLMQQHGIRARGKRRFRIATTDSRHGLPIAPQPVRQLRIQHHAQRARNYALDESQRQQLGQRMQRDAVRIAEGGAAARGAL